MRGSRQKKLAREMDDFDAGAALDDDKGDAVIELAEVISLNPRQSPSATSTLSLFQVGFSLDAISRMQSQAMEQPSMDESRLLEPTPFTPTMMKCHPRPPPRQKPPTPTPTSEPTPEIAEPPASIALAAREAAQAYVRPAASAHRCEPRQHRVRRATVQPVNLHGEPPYAKHQGPRQPVNPVDQAAAGRAEDASGARGDFKLESFQRLKSLTKRYSLSFPAATRSKPAACCLDTITFSCFFHVWSIFSVALFIMFLPMSRRTPTALQIEVPSGALFMFHQW